MYETIHLFYKTAYIPTYLVYLQCTGASCQHTSLVGHNDLIYGVDRCCWNFQEGLGDYVAYQLYLVEPVCDEPGLLIATEVKETSDSFEFVLGHVVCHFRYSCPYCPVAVNGWKVGHTHVDHYANKGTQVLDVQSEEVQFALSCIKVGLEYYMVHKLLGEEMGVVLNGSQDSEAWGE